MTTIKRKWNYAPIVLGLFLIFASTKAIAEEDAVNSQPQTAQTQQAKPQKQQAYDQQYRLPTSYEGKYYPNDETAIGYYGTTNSARNDSGQNGSYYYYYY